jgi:transposase InsO family protein
VRAENDLVADLTRITGSQRRALAVTGLSRSTWHYRRHPRERVVKPIPQTERAYQSRISPADRDRIIEHVLAGWAQQNSVDHAFASAWDAGVMLGSARTWWRIAAEIEDQMLRPQIPTRKSRRQARQAPVLKATGPGQVWSWDITDLYSPWRGKVFKAYKITDIFSRKIVGFRVEDREADHLAVDMFTNAIAAHGAPRVVHADSGAAMTSNLLRAHLSGQHIELTHNRPYVSNDNPFSEAGFRTMKYRPGYPKVFTDLNTARTYITDYVSWYNHQHKHSGIALFSPAQVHDGTWRAAWQTRETTLQRYFQAHPERFRARPRTPAPANTVGINLPNEQQQKHAA